MNTMHATQFDRFGAANVLQYRQVEQPKPNAGEFLIKVIASGINPIDSKIREGSSFVAQKRALPSGLGFDVCGEIVDINGACADFKIGDIVLGSIGRHDNPSSYAEYCIGKPDDVIKKPEQLAPIVAASLPIAGLTAWQALHRCAKVQAGQRILIHAAAGGVGHLCVQLAKIAGCEVIGTASARHHPFLNQLGVDHIIDYTETDFTQTCKDLDAVIDLVGGDTGKRSARIIKPKGTLVTVPTISRDAVLRAAEKYPIHATGMLADNSNVDLAKLADLCASGQLSVKIDSTLPLKDADLAHQRLTEGHTQGKIVLIP